MRVVYLPCGCICVVTGVATPGQNRMCHGHACVTLKYACSELWRSLLVHAPVMAQPSSTAKEAYRLAFISTVPVAGQCACAPLLM
jgi:hypothetical protein